MLYIANYDHLGIILWGADTISALLDRQEDWLRRYPGFKVGWDNEAFSYDYLYEKNPALLERLRRMRRDYNGRVGMGTSTYGQPLSVYIGGESNVRQLTYAIRTVQRHFNTRPPVYIMSEHAFHAQLPQLLDGAGFEGAILRTHFMMYGANPEYDLPLANWFGLDGRVSVDTVPTYRGQACYCPINGFTVDTRTQENFPFGFNTLDNKILTDYPNAFSAPLEDFETLFHGRVEPLLASRADDPRQPEGIAARYHDREGCAFVVDGEIIAALGSPRGDIMPLPEDFAARMPWGLCGNWIWQECRAVENRLSALQCAAALAQKPEAYPYHMLDEIWKALMVSQHHDIWICALQDEARVFLDKAKSALHRVRALTDGDAGWFNPLPWRREDPVCDAGGAIVAVDGLACAASVCESNPSPITWDADTLCLTTGRYELRLHPDGGFAALSERATGEPLLRADRRSCYLAGTIDGVHHVSVGTWKIVIETHRAVLYDVGRIGSLPYTVKWTLYADYPRIDCEIEYSPDTQNIGRVGQDSRDATLAFIHDEKLRLKVFPCLADGAEGVRDLPFAVAKTRRACVEGNLWVAIEDEHRGLAVLNRGAMGAIRERDGAFSIPLAFSMYYVWCGGRGNFDADEAALLRAKDRTAPSHERPRHFLSGTYEAELALLPYAGTWRQSRVHRRAIEYNQPMPRISETSAAGIRRTGLALQISENLYLSSLYRYGGRLCARVYELDGETGDIHATLSGTLALIRQTDLLDAPVGDWTDSIRVCPHQVVTFEISERKD